MQGMTRARPTPLMALHTMACFTAKIKHDSARLRWRASAGAGACAAACTAGQRHALQRGLC